MSESLRALFDPIDIRGSQVADRRQVEVLSLLLTAFVGRFLRFRVFNKSLSNLCLEVFRDIWRFSELLLKIHFSVMANQLVDSQQSTCAVAIC